MKNIRQAVLGFLAALLSTAVILGSLSLSLSESGLKLALHVTPTRTRGPRLSTMTMTKTAGAATVYPGETSTVSLFTPSVTATITPMFPFATLPSPTPSCSPPVGWSPIKIQAGDTLDGIAQLYNATIEALILANCLGTEELITDTILYVPGLPPTESSIPCGPPAGWIFYTVLPNDTLFHIGLAFGVTVAELQFANCLESSTLIRAGRRIFVPNIHTRTPTAAPTHLVPTTQHPSDTPSSVPTYTLTVQVSPTPTPVSTITPIPTTRTPTPSPTGTTTPEPPSPTPTDTFTPTETTTASPTETPTPTPEPTSTETSTPVAVPTNTPSVVPTSTPSGTPEPPTLTETPR